MVLHKIINHKKIKPFYGSLIKWFFDKMVSAGKLAPTYIDLTLFVVILRFALLITVINQS
jgi:hypothetical protein